MKSLRQIKLGAVMSYIAILINILAGFIYIPWMVKQIGKSDYGLYTLAMSIVNFFLMDFGISGTISRYISLYRAEGEEKKIENLLGLTSKLYLLIDGIIALLLITLFFFINYLFKELTPSELIKFKAVYLIVGLFSLVSFPFLPLNGIITSYERFFFLKICDVIQRIVSIVLIVAALLSGRGLYTLVLINAIISILVIGIKLYFIHNMIGIKLNISYYDKSFMVELLHFSVWLTIISIAQRLIINISPTLLGMMSGTIQISVFSIGSSLEGYTWTFANALNGLFLPEVTRLSLCADNTKYITDLMIKIGRLQLTVIGFLFSALLTFGHEFLILWMGKDFENSYYVAILLIFPGIITLTQEIAYNYLIALNEVKWRALDYIGTALISVILALVFIPKMGAVGAALGACIGMTAGHVIIMNFIYYYKFQLNIPLFFQRCHVSMVFPLIVSIALGVIIQMIFPVKNLQLFFLKTGIWCLFYISIMWKLGLNKDEKKVILSTVCYKLNK